MQNGAKKTLEIERLEENARTKPTTFIPTNSNDYRNDADNFGVIEPFVDLTSGAVRPFMCLARSRFSLIQINMYWPRTGEHAHTPVG